MAEGGGGGGAVVDGPPGGGTVAGKVVRRVKEESGGREWGKRVAGESSGVLCAYVVFRRSVFEDDHTCC